MKLSEMSTNAACDMMIAIAEPVANIAEDEKVAEAIRAFSEKKSAVTNMDAGLLILKKVVPLALKDHRDDVYQILSAMTGKRAEEIGTQPIVQTIADAKAILDRDLVDFFTSSAPMASSVS